MADPTSSNLRRLMAQQELTVESVVEKTRLDRRTILSILEGSHKPHSRTISRLAKGLGVSTDEFFVNTAQLLYRRFDRQTNPVVEEVVESKPELFSDWTVAEFDELHSRFGTGGALTAEGVLAAVETMNVRRELQDKLALLLETSHAELVRKLIDTLYEQAVLNGNPIR